MNRAPFGYVNNKSTRNIEPHPTNSKVVKKAFQEYSKENHTLVSLAQFLADLGVMSCNGTPLAKVSIKRLLTHRAYIGFIGHNGEWFEGNFEPIISPKLFEAVQKILATREKPRKVKNGHNFPFTGLFRCGECESMISAQWATGRLGGKYRYYRCSKKKGKCGQKYLREEALVAQLKERLQSISLCDRYTNWMLNEIDKWQEKETTLSQSNVQNLSNKIKVNEKRLEKLVSTYLDEDIPKDIYLKKKDGIMRSTLALKEKKKDLEHGGNIRNEPLREWILDMKQANFLVSHDDFPKTKELVQKIGTNPFVRDKSAHFGVPSPSAFVAKRRRFLPPCAPAARRVSGLSPEEVSFCAEILTFARTYFEEKTD